MTRLDWDTVGERIFETGVDRCVLFIDGQPGIPWIGLLSVTEKTTGFEAQPYYIDGVKYLTLYAQEDFAATLEAYTYPDEFLQCEGIEPIVNGFYASQQDRKTFNLCYRTRIGNDVDGYDHGYKMHFVYNAVAAPSDKTYNTIGENVEASTFSWDLTTTPIAVDEMNPTAHFVLDSRDISPAHLEVLEAQIYGYSGTYPITSTLLTWEQIVDILSNPAFDLNATFWDGGDETEFSPWNIRTAGYPSSIATAFEDVAVDMSIDGGDNSEPYTSSLDSESPYSQQTHTLDGGVV